MLLSISQSYKHVAENWNSKFWRAELFCFHVRRTSSRARKNVRLLRPVKVNGSVVAFRRNRVKSMLLTLLFSYHFLTGILFKVMVLFKNLL